jgi:hypothetical protein
MNFERSDWRNQYDIDSVCKFKNISLSVLASCDNKDNKFESIIDKDIIRGGGQCQNTSTCLCTDLSIVQKEVLEELREIGYEPKTPIGFHISTN